MPVESASDLASFYDTNEFAVQANIAAGTLVDGIFENDYVLIEVGEVEVESNLPLFGCATADLPAITLGTTTAVINSVTYVIIENKPDGTGQTMLRLRENV